MIIYKNPQYLFQKIHNFIAKLSILTARFLGFNCIKWNSELNESTLNDGKFQGFIVMLFVVVAVVTIGYIDTIAVPMLYKHDIDIVLTCLSSIISITTTVIASVLPIYKKKELISAYKTAIELGKSILPFKTDPLMDKKFVRKVLAKIFIDTLCFIDYALLICFGTLYFDDVNVILMMLRIIIIIPQICVLMFPMTIILIAFTFASHLIKIISLRVRKIIEKIEELYVQKEIHSTNARFIMDCCALSDDLEYLSECYCKVIQFANNIIKILEKYLLFFCLYIFLLIVTQATNVYSDVFYDSQEANIIQTSFFLLILSLLHFLVYGPQKILKRTKKLQEIVNSLLLEEMEPRLDKSVRNFFGFTANIN